MWQIGETISYDTFNGRRDAVIIGIPDQDHYICQLANGKHVIVHYLSIAF